MAVAGGAQVVLNCTTGIAQEYTQISWTFVENSDLIVRSCVVWDWNPLYSVSYSLNGNCDLIINSPITTAIAGLYACTETYSGEIASAQVIIIGENSLAVGL